MVAIIGGSGFVGSRLISRLKGKNILNIDKKPSPYYQKITKIGDIRNYDQILIPDGTKSVVLLAAEHRDDVNPQSLYYDVNCEGTKNVLKKMDEMGVKNLIFTSSVAVYGLNKNNPDENHEIDPFNHYGKSKWEAEKIIREWYESDKEQKSVVIIRPTVIFGERNRGNVYNLLKYISDGKFIMVGSGQNKKSMAYVGNVVQFIIQNIEKSKKSYNIYNYSDKPDYNMLDLTKFIENKMKIKTLGLKIPYKIGLMIGKIFDIISFILKKKLPISYVRVKKFCATTQFNSSKAHKIFKPPYTIDDGLEKTLDHEFIYPKEDDVLFYSE